MTTPYNSNYSNTFPFSNTCLQLLLAASTVKTWTIPGDPYVMYRASFRCSSTAEIWVAYNATATIPTSDTVTNSSYQEMVPLNECRYVNGGDTLSFISAGTPSVSVSLLQLQPL